MEQNGTEKRREQTGETEYLDSLVDKMEALGLAEESYVNQLSERLEPILGEAEEPEKSEELSLSDGDCTGETDGEKQNAGKQRAKRTADGRSGAGGSVSGEKCTNWYTFYRDPAVWLLLLLTGVSLSVILKSGFYEDDAVLSFQSKYFIWNTGTDIQTYLKAVVQSWLNQGRFFPISNIYVSLLMHYVSSAFVYKLIILLFVVLNVYVFGAFVRRLTGSRSFSLLVMAVVPMCMQVRAYHDPLVAYHLLMQVLLLFLLFTAMALRRFLEKKRAVWLLVSLAVYTIGLMTYEVFYISIFFLCFLVFFYEAESVRKAFCWRNIKRTFFIMLPYALIMAGLFFLSLRVKQKYGVSYDGIQAVFSLKKILLTAAKQIVAAAPLSYRLLCNEQMGHMFHWNPLTILKTAKLQDFAAAFVLAAAAFPLLRKPWKLKNKGSLLGMALTLLLAPAALIGVSSKYQRELIWGIGHIPVYLEYFGITVLGVLLAGWLLDRLKKEKQRRLAAVFCSLALGFALLVQIQDNRAVVEGMNNANLYCREMLDKSIEEGVFSKLEDGSILVVENEPVYPGKDYFSYKTKKHLQVYGKTEFLEQGCPENTTVYILSYKADRYQQKLTLKEAIYESAEKEPRILHVYRWQNQ